MKSEFALSRWLARGSVDFERLRGEERNGFQDQLFQTSPVGIGFTGCYRSHRHRRHLPRGVLHCSRRHILGHAAAAAVLAGLRAGHGAEEENADHLHRDVAGRRVRGLARERDSAVPDPV